MSDDVILRMLYPATRWQDALPTGNGKMGAMLYGNIHSDRILMNHENYWYGHQGMKMPDVSYAISDIRGMLIEGKYYDANDYLVGVLHKNGYNPQNSKYFPGPVVNVKYMPESAFTSYSRAINCSTGEVSAAWSENDVKYHKKLFVSREDDAFVFSMYNEKNVPITAELSVGLHDEKQLENEKIKVKIHENSIRDSMFIFKGSHMRGENFCLCGYLRTDGEVKIIDDRAIICEASYITFIGRISDSDANIGNDLSDLVKLASSYDYSELLDRHSILHRELFKRSVLKLGDGYTERHVEAMLMKAYSGVVENSFFEMMYNFGRYLLISGCASDGLPLNLQGKWNGHYNPMWNSGYISNENIQMCFWQALTGNLPEMVESYFNLFDNLMDDFRENARKIYGCEGIYIPLLFTADSGLVEDLQPHCVYWIGGAAWIAKLYYDYWLYTCDDGMLTSRILPMLTETSLFYKDYFYEGDDGFLVSAPSNSPENAPPRFTKKDDCMINEVEVQVNSTIDFAVAKEVVSNLIVILKYLDYEQSIIEEWQCFLDKFRPYEINTDGAIREWLHDDFSDNYHHRHESHIYPVFPGTEITNETDDGLFDACKVALDKRLIIGMKEQTGWSLMHMANARARMGDGESAIECLMLATRSCVGNNLLMYHNDWRHQGITLDLLKDNEGIFQVDANMGWSAAMLEMLVFSKQGLIKVLPALPDQWGKGELNNVLCAGGISLSIKWDKERGVSMRLNSMKDQIVCIQLPDWAVSKGNYQDLDKERKGQCYKVIELEKDRPKRFDISLTKEVPSL